MHPSQRRFNGAWEHEKARRLGAVLLPPTLAQHFVLCFVFFAILLVAHICLIRSIRGLYNFASPGDLAIKHVAIDVIVLVQGGSQILDAFAASRLTVGHRGVLASRRRLPQDQTYIYLALHG